MKRALAVCLALILSGEAVLRWGVGLGDPPLAQLDPALEYRLIPNRVYSRWGNEIRINRFGLRAPDHPDTPEDGAAHLLVIGDSVVYGNHFLDQSQTIAARLSDRLSSQSCTIRALPIAASSWGPINQAAALKELGTFGASAAALVVSFHDLVDVPGHPAHILPYRLTPARTAIGDAATSVYERLLRPDPAPDPRPLAARASASLLAMDQMADQLKQANVQTWLVYHPTTGERAGRPHPSKASFLDWAARRNIPVLDLTLAAPEASYRDQIHPDAAGAAAMARALAEVIGPAIACP